MQGFDKDQASKSKREKKEPDKGEKKKLSWW